MVVNQFSVLLWHFIVLSTKSVILCAFDIYVIGILWDWDLCQRHFMWLVFMDDVYAVLSFYRALAGHMSIIMDNQYAIVLCSKTWDPLFGE